MRGVIGIYSDDVFHLESRPVGAQVSADQAFLLFACAVGAHFDDHVLIGRTVRAERPADYPLPSATRVVELPYYESLHRPLELLRASVGTVAAMWRSLRDLDAVWVFGPNPFGVMLIGLALLRRKRVVLGVRQDTVPYYRSRLPSRRWSVMIPVVWAMDRTYRLLARRLTTTVVGDALARHYDRGGARVLAMTVTLVRAADVLTAMPERSWTGRIDLLAVGRLDPEKNPLLLIDALARLEHEEPGRYALTWIGRGTLEAAARRRARELGVESRVDFVGYVPFGADLLERYRRAHVLVHVSLTEGVPQVLVEARACATPIVATDVGGVPATLDGGRAGVLVPSRDVTAVVEAVRWIAGDAELRQRLVTRGLELARETTLEREAERVARFLAGG